MKWILLAFVLLTCGAYVSAWFGIFNGVFGKPRRAPYTKEAMRGSPYEPYSDKLLEGIERLSQQKSERLTVRAFDGVPLAADYYSANSKKTVVLLHGVFSHPLNNFALQALALLHEGYNVLLVHQRAHGDSGGKYTSFGCFEQQDCLCWLKLLVQKYQPESLALYGISMGGYTAASLCDQVDGFPVKALIVDCAFRRPYDAFKRQYCRQKVRFPWWLLGPQVIFAGRLTGKFDLRRGDAVAHLKGNRIPTLFLHGTHDEVVPLAIGQENFAACASKKQALWVKNAGHTLSFVCFSEEENNTFFRFLQDNL